MHVCMSVYIHKRMHARMHACILFPSMYVGIRVCMKPWPRGRRTWAGKGVQEERRVGKRPGRSLLAVAVAVVPLCTMVILFVLRHDCQTVDPFLILPLFIMLL